MFTKDDYAAYFDQIARIERKMIYGVYDLKEEIKDPGTSRVLQKIGDDEVRHYGYVLKMLKTIGEQRPFEMRCESREYCLGRVRFKQPQGFPGKVLKACCVNWSKKGICLESAANFSPETMCEMEIHLFDKAESVSCRGRVVWSKEVEPGFYISGIVFSVASGS